MVCFSLLKKQLLSLNMRHRFKFDAHERIIFRILKLNYFILFSFVLILQVKTFFSSVSSVPNTCIHFIQLVGVTCV